MKAWFRITRAAIVVLLAACILSFASASAFAKGIDTASSADASPLVVGAVSGHLGTHASGTYFGEETNPLYEDELAGLDLVGEKSLFQEIKSEEKADASADLRGVVDGESISLRSTEQGAAALNGEALGEDVAVSRDDAVARIREALMGGIEEVAVTIKTKADIAQEWLEMFYEALAEPDADDPDAEYASLVDYLRCNYLQVGCDCEYIDEDGIYTVTYTYHVVYAASKAQTDQLFSDVQQLVDSFGFTENTSDLQKFKTIYDYICGHVVYDYEHLKNESYLLKYSAYAALEHGSAVCQGYSQLLYVMCGCAGVPTRIILGDGDGENHAWNIVGLEQDDGKTLFYNVDSTWDSSFFQAGLPYEYFLLSEDDFNGDHTRGNWNEVLDYAGDAFVSAYPMASVSYVPEAEVVDSVKYSLIGEEAIASAYVSQNVDATSVEIPETVTAAGRDYTVTAIGDGFLYESSGAAKIKEITLPSTIRTIGSMAFCQTAIAKINFPEGLLSIGDHAFWSCNSLVEVVLPSTLEVVRYRAFGACHSLEFVTMLGNAAIEEGAFIKMADRSALTVSTLCQHQLIEGGGDTYITRESTSLNPISGAFDSGHKLRHIEGCSAACESQGFAEYWVCSVCGKMFSDADGNVEQDEPSYTDPLDHDWDDGWVSIEPTETSDGEIIYTCKRCDLQRTETIIAKEWTLVEIVSPSCEENGCERYENSSGQRREVILQALGHDWDDGDVTDRPTCTKAGVKTFKCSRCYATYTEPVAALGHEYDSVVTTPTCTDDGYTTHTCASCGDSYIDSRVDALGHDWDDCDTTIAPTCTKAGEKTFTCARCGDVHTEAIAPLGHEYHSVVTKPACTKGGYTTHTCSRCGDSYTDAKTAALGHKWDAGKVTTAPTYTARGVRTFACTRCKATRTESVAMLPKLAQAIAPAKKTYTVKFSKVKSKAQKLAVKFKASGGGKVAYKAAKAAGGKVKIAKNGKVTVAKGTKKGTYTLKVKVTAPETGKYAKTTKTVKLKIRVK